MIKPFSISDPPEHYIPRRFLKFRHPAFRTGNIFLRLYAVDATPGDQIPYIKYGIHHGTALDAWKIVANDRPGFLATR
jgi:hypothetical protein